MGTRGTIHFVDGKRTIGSLYTQYDAYPSGFGDWLHRHFAGMRVTNGYSLDQRDGRWANGIGCLGAQVIAKFKDGIGGYYLTNAKDRQEYNYFLSEGHKGEVLLKLTDESNKVLYKGSLALFDGYKLEGRPRPVQVAK